MKQTIYILIFLLAACGVKAQEVASDTLGLPPADYVPPFDLSADVKDYGGFLLDMGLMELAPTIPFTLRPEFSYKDKTPNYTQLFKLNPNMQFTQGNYSSLGGAMNHFSPSSSMTMSSFRLKNGMRINTYGQYNYKGERQIRPSALPWQRNNFKGAFELKSSNGSFGVRIEVSRGRY